MLFDYDIIVPAGTLQANPTRKVCKLTSGTLQEIRVKFPPGPATLVHVVILDNLHQIMPINPDGSINIDDETIKSSNLQYKLISPFELYIDGWSPNAVYEHTITAQFEVDPDSVDPFTEFEKLLLSSTPKKKR